MRALEVKYRRQLKKKFPYPFLCVCACVHARWETLVKVIQTLAYISLLTGFLVLLHQYISYGVWFETDQIHHETLAILFFSLGLGILLGFIGGMRKKREG